MSDSTQKTPRNELERLSKIEQCLNTEKLPSLKKKASAILGKVPNNVDISEWDKLPISENASPVEKMRAFKKSRLASGEAISELRDEGKR